MQTTTCDHAVMTPKTRTPEETIRAELDAIAAEREKLARAEAALAARELAAVAAARSVQPRPVQWRTLGDWMGRSGSNVCTEFLPQLDVQVTVRPVVRPAKTPPEKATAKSKRR